MKKHLLLSVICLLPLSVFAQNCGGYYYLAKNAEIQMTNYDKDGTAGVVVTSQVSHVKSIPGGMQSDFQSAVKDKDGKVMEQGSGTMKCLHGNLSVDMKATMPSGSMNQFKNMRIKADQAYLVFPATMSIGQSLPDAISHMEMIRKESNKRFATLDYTISNRKVVGKEKITTPAGSWNCFKITSNMKMRIKIGIGIAMRFKVTQWFAPGFGIVKTADYNKKGKKIGAMVLTAFKK